MRNSSSRPALGTYRWPWAGVENGWGEVLYTASPIYGVRQAATANGRRLQVQLAQGGWINVAWYDVQLTAAGRRDLALAQRG